MRSDSGCPIPPAAPKIATFLSGADSDANSRRVPAVEVLRARVLNIDVLIAMAEKNVKSKMREMFKGSVQLREADYSIYTGYRFVNF